MSDLLNFDDDVDIFADTKHGDATEANKELDALFEVNAGHMTNDSLDDILKPAVNDDIFSTKPKLKKKKSIRKKATIFGADDFDPFASPKANNVIGGNVPPPAESGAKESMTVGNTDDSLDFLLDSQPLGTVLSSDDLLSLDPLSTSVVRPGKKPTEKCQVGDEASGVSKPSEDLFHVTTEDRKESNTAGDVADVEDLFSTSDRDGTQPGSNTLDDIFSVKDIKDKKQEEGYMDDDIFTLSNSNDKVQPESDTSGDIFSVLDSKDEKQQEANVVKDTSTAPKDVDALTPEIDSDEELFPELREHETNHEENSTNPTYDDLFDLDEGKFASTNTNQSSESDLFGLDDEDILLTNKLDNTGQTDDIFDQTDELLTANESNNDDMSNDIFNLIDDGPTGEPDQADFMAGLSKKPLMGSVDSLDALLLDQPEGTVAANDDDDLMSPSLPLVADNTSAGLVSMDEKKQSETDNLTSDNEELVLKIQTEGCHKNSRKSEIDKNCHILSGHNIRKQIVAMALSHNKPLSHVDSLDMLLNEQPEGMVPESDDLKSLIIPSMGADMISLPLQTEVSDIGTRNSEGSSGQSIQVKGEADFATVKGTGQRCEDHVDEDFENLPKRPHHESMDSLDILLDSQPDGMVPESADLQSLNMPSMGIDLMSLPVPRMSIKGSKENSKGTSEQSVIDETEESVKKQTNDDHGLTLKNPQQSPRNESMNSLDILLDSQPDGMVPESADLQSLNMPSMGIDLMSLPVPRMSIKGSKGNSKGTSELSVIDETEESVKKQTNDDHGLTLKNPQQSPRNESMDSLDILLDSQPDGMVPESADLQSLHMPSVSMDLMSLPVPTEMANKGSKGNSKGRCEQSAKDETELESVKRQTYDDHGPDSNNAQRKPRNEFMDSLDTLLDFQPDGMVPESADLQSLNMPSASMDFMSHPRQSPDHKPRNESKDILDMLLDSQPAGMVPSYEDLQSLAMQSVVAFPSEQGETNKSDGKFELKRGDKDLKICTGGKGHHLQDRLDGDTRKMNGIEVNTEDILNKIPFGSVDAILGQQPGENEVGEETKTLEDDEIGLTKTRLDSLDILLDSQPAGTVSENDSLQSLMTPSTDASHLLAHDLTSSMPAGLKEEICTIKNTKSSYTLNYENQTRIEIKSPLDRLENLRDNQSCTTENAEPDILGSTHRMYSLDKSKTCLDSLDILINSQPVHSRNSEEQFCQEQLVDTKPRLDSLDILLENQPENNESTKPENQGSKSRLDSLDLLLENQPENMESTQPENQESKSRLDSLDLLLENQPENMESTQPENQESKSRLDSLDLLLENQPENKESRQPDNHVPKSCLDSLDISDKSQEAVREVIADVTTSLDLMSAPLKKDSQTEKADPLEDDFAFADDDDDDNNVEVPDIEREPKPEIVDTGFKDTVVDTAVKDIPAKGKQGKQKKRAMERSFEDLLNGLSDESEPELDEMILSDDNDNTNLEKPLKEQSILVSPDQGKKSVQAKTYDDSSTPARLPSTNGDKSVLTSTPNTESTKGIVPDVEVKLFTPDDEEEDLKSWEMMDQEGMVKPAADNNDDNSDEVVMRNRSSNADSTDDKDIDLSAIEDTNHLDVNINKHKSSIGKKGSIALRRKPSRKSRRSVMAEGDDAIFQDSSSPKSTDLMNGDAGTHNDKDADKFDMSPPAKRPNPSVMVPLPGMMGKPPSQRVPARHPMEEDDDDDDVPKPAKRVSKPPPGAFKLPNIMPGQSPKPFQEIHRKNTDSSSHTFEKPALKSAKPPAVKESEKDKEPIFDKPALRKVEGRGRERSLSSEERDVMFEKPALRSTPKPREVTPEATSETETGVFSKPALRETPKKPSIIDRREPSEPPSEQPISRNLRSTNKSSIGQKPSAEKHTFDKPKLRSTAQTDSLDKPNEQDNSEGSTFYEKPVLRSTKQENKDVPPPEDNDSASHKFDKPALRNTGSRNLFSKKDSGNVGQFDKPALRKTPTPDREVKPAKEPKGIFDKPSLRKTENTSNNSDTIGKSDYKSSFPETQLRKTTPPPKEVVPEKPSWLKDAAEKQSKALDVIQTKENTNSGSKKELPSWLDKTPVLKSNRGQPLQDTSNGQSESFEDRKAAITPRSREPSFGSDYDSEKRKSSSTEFKTPQNNYVPSWMRQGKAPSTTGGSTFISPASSTPGSSDEVPQWKKELAQRRSSRKESSPMDTPKREVSSEPEWKKNIQLRKTRPGDTPAKDKQTVEPEWKKAAEEKRARLRNSTIES